jgi:hypothetical protein
LDFALAFVGIAAGLAVGGLAGFRLGERFRGRRRAYWVMNVAAVLGCAILDFVGLASGRQWLAYAALGLMGGLITGLKYGHSESIGPRRGSGQSEAPADVAAGAPVGAPTPSHDEPSNVPS